MNYFLCIFNLEPREVAGSMMRLLIVASLIVSAGSAYGEGVDLKNRRVHSLIPDTKEDLQAIERRVAKVVELGRQATVCVQSGGSSGSGVIISEDGYVLTAGHVAVEPGRSVTFIFSDGRKVKGKALGINVGIDAGLMKITDKGKWPWVELGDMDRVASGHWVVAMGHPGGFDKERSVVARLGRIYRVRPTVIQSDCTIIGGDSGGPLFDLDGKVVGIHSRISNGLRQNFHVPISIYTQNWDRLVAGDVWNRLPRRGNLRRGGPYIGVQGQGGPELGQGAALARVIPHSPAAQAGLKPGDVVVELDRLPVGSFGDLAAIVGRLKPGDRVPVTVQRKGDRLELEVVIGKVE